MPVNQPHHPASTSAQPAIPLREAIARELETVREKRSALLAPALRYHWQVIIILTCLTINGIFFLLRRDYVTLFVAASFYLNMGYFITLLIPTSSSGAQGSLPEIAKFRSWLSENGVRTSTTQFTQIFINSFFINSSALALGICLLFSIDIVLVIVAFTEGLLSLHTTLIIIGQSAIFIIFYTLIWKTEPFTSRFERDLHTVKTRLAQDLPPAAISFLFLMGFLVIVLLFLTTIILMPGITLDAFMTQSGITELAHRFAPIGLLVITQYFLIRHIHGITSRAMAERLLDHREQALEELISTAGTGAGVSSAGGYEEMTQLLETRIYTIKRNTLLETFPVFVVDLDFSVLLDSTTKLAIRGYIRKE